MSSQAGHATVAVDLAQVRRSFQRIRQVVGVEVWPVIKADAYGLGAAQVAEALADLADGYCLFSLQEAIDADVWARTHKPSILLGPPQSMDPEDYRRHHARPAVSTAAQAEALRRADPMLCIDTGMQRFACPPELIEEALATGAIREAFTHAPTLDQARRLAELVGGRGLRLHAAASSLLDTPAAWLDAVRPGLALYRDAVVVRAPLVEVRQTRGPLGYGGVGSDRHGVILCGYAAGLRPGPCRINGRSSRVVETGMQSAYVEVTEGDRVGDEVALLGDGLSTDAVAAAWRTTPHEVLVRLSRTGPRRWIA
jgi:alanine racemase